MNEDKRRDSQMVPVNDRFTQYKENRLQYVNRMDDSRPDKLVEHYNTFWEKRFG